jgi:hypothetical protein
MIPYTEYVPEATIPSTRSSRSKFCWTGEIIKRKK